MICLTICSMDQTDHSESINHVRNAYDAVAPTYEQAAGKLAYFRPVVAQFLQELQPGQRLLDVGCGPGHLTSGLASAIDVVGVDLSPKMIEMARFKRPHGTYRVHDFHSGLPEELGSFDAIMSSSCFEFCRDLPSVLVNLARAMRPGSRLYFTVCERREDLPLQRQQSVRISAPPHELDIYFWSFSEIARALDEAGLRVVRFNADRGWFSRHLNADIHYGYWWVERPRGS